MAIISDVPGLNAKVMVHGLPLDEFPSDNEPDTSDTVTRYVEAISGLNFIVAITCDESLDPAYKASDLYMELFVDGHKAGKCTLERAKWIGRHGTNYHFTGFRLIENGQWVHRTMAFSEVNVVDENDRVAHPAAEIEAIRSLGEIKVTVLRAKLQPTTPRSSTSISNHNFTIIDSVPEKKLKGRAISHQVKLGEAIPQPYSLTKRKHCKRIDAEPFATFIFRYRSRDALKAECIISRTASPELLEDRPIETLTAEEARELVRRLKDQQGARRSLPPRFKREVKQEVKDEPGRGERLSDADVIDLGSEDSDVEITSVRLRKRRRISGPIEIIDLSDE
ncbi:uncharacterized protein BKCO1_4500018 [Diplodia corticola]|uniref:DUF7918 domain-containing protein n=1 Tax=Diplodia corticola TaxID=236234 RepID=A0A1J9QTK0_9PEZI|nr:uncharacterized protein BKCO1_4500018 [Diplodia corticola]OJD31721.1 hypothetical protein BKCO1_4500018 [Diplodia corticola]